MDLKRRLKSGEQVYGTMITTFECVDLPRMLANYGFDYCIIDCEHGSFTTREVANAIAAARGIDMPVIVRIPEMRRECALKFMEMGATGLLLPNTEDAETARMLVDYTKYAPMGHRGVSMGRPHTNFIKANPVEYMARANEETLLICQIESRKGVENIDEILAVPGIDAALIGPNDMSQDYGKLGQYDDPEIVGAITKVMASAKAQGKFFGAHFSGAKPLMRYIDGMQLVMWCSDIGLLAAGAAGLKELKER